MAFSGAWLQSQGPFYTEKDPPLHTADPSHADTTEVDANAWTYNAPAGTAQSGELPFDEWMGRDWVQPDQTPYFDPAEGANTAPHYSDPYVGVTGIGGGNLTGQQSASRYAAVDYGDPMADGRAVDGAPFQFSDERYGGDRFDSLGPQPVSEAALRRGPNSEPANNPPIEGQPDGFRRGSDLVPWLDRKFRIGERYHDRHVVRPNDYDPPGNQERPSGISQYLSPFNSLENMKTRVWNTPERTVQPPDFSESITVDPAGGSTMPEGWL